MVFLKVIYVDISKVAYTLVLDHHWGLGLSVIVAARQYFCLGLHQLLRLKWDFFILHFPNEPVANFLVHAVWCWAGMHSEFVIAYLMRTAAYCCRKDSWQKWLKLLLSVSLWDLNH